MADTCIGDIGGGHNQGWALPYLSAIMVMVLPGWAILVDAVVMGVTDVVLQYVCANVSEGAAC